ncbi:M20/M25/M40 family metallo-hydrolase [Candidatus Bathyarchaeota archaeon]|nr:M20/M25/M40 family metallo-hydrolase [Candidatus Bathyarchaeota archaeon]
MSQYNVEENRDRYIQLIRGLVKDSRDGEEALQRSVAGKFSELGCEVETLKLLPIGLSPEKEFAAKESIDLSERISVVGRHTGTGGGRSLMLFAHPDSEELRGLDEWTHDPFEADVQDGRVYGWGVADDLLGVATMIGALDALLGSGAALKGDLYLCSTASKRNARGVTALLDKGYKADAAIYLHPAESGEGLNEIKAFASGLLNFRVTIRGRLPETSEPGHTVFAHLGTNPIGKAVQLIQALERLDEARGREVHDESLDDAVGRSTNILVSHINCGDSTLLSRMSEKCVVGASVSFPPRENLSDVKALIEDAVKGVSEGDPWLSEHPPMIEWIFGTQAVETPVDHPLYQIASGAVENVTGKVPHVNPLHTASDIRNPILFSGIPTVGFGSLAGDLVHSGGHDEWIDIEDYLKAIRVCARIIEDWCS